MSTVTTYPNGFTLSSSALTIPQINAVFQNLTCGMLGISPPNYSLVKVSWPTQGQPYTALPSQNCCYLSCVPKDVDYNRVRDMQESGTTVAEQNWTYTRGWKIAWVFVGPLSTDQARQVWSATFLDWVYDTLSTSNLYIVNDPPSPVRVPAEQNAEWWEEVHFSITLYEQVNETLAPPTGGIVKSVETKVYDAQVDPVNPVADFTVDA